jgi:O-antigen ligase
VGVAVPGGGYGPTFQAGATVLLAVALLVALAFGLLPAARLPTTAVLSAACLALLAGFAALSMAWAGDNGRAFADAVRVAGYAGLFTLVVIASPARSARAWIIGLTLGLLGVAGLALGTRYFPDLAPHQDLPRFLPSVATRLSYPVNYWNGLAAMMALAVVALAWLSVESDRRVSRALSVGAMPVPALALYLTGSRGGALALFVGLVALIAFSPRRIRLLGGALLAGAGSALLISLATAQSSFVDADRKASDAAEQGAVMLLVTIAMVVAVASGRLWLDRPLARLRLSGRPLAAVVVIVALGLVAGVVAINPVERIRELSEKPVTPSSNSRGFVASHLTSASGTGRAQFWGEALDAFAHRPVAGIGSGGYQYWWAQHGSFGYSVRDAHSLYFETLGELGILGFLLLLGFLIPPLVRGSRLLLGRERATAAGPLALAVCGAWSAQGDWTWELPASFAPVVVALGVLAGPAIAPATQGARSRYAAGVTALVAAWLALVAAGVVFVAQTKLEDSRAAVRAGHLRDAVADAEAAAAVEPWASDPRLQVALIEEQRRNIPAARKALDEAIRRDSSDWRLFVIAARLARSAGDRAADLHFQTHARSLNPKSPLVPGR